MKIPKYVNCVICGKEIQISDFDSNMTEKEQKICMLLFQKTIICEDCEKTGYKAI